MTAVTATDLSARLTLLEQAVEYALAGVALVDDADLDRSTPCTGWNLRTVLVHLADVAEALSDQVPTGALDLTLVQRPDDGVVAVVQGRTQHLLDLLHGAVEASDRSDRAAVEPARNAAISGAVEYSVHGWDVFAALQRERQIPDSLATELLTITSAAIDDDARSPEFGLPVAVPSSARPSARLIGFLGRRSTGREAPTGHGGAT